MFNQSTFARCQRAYDNRMPEDYDEEPGCDVCEHVESECTCNIWMDKSTVHTARKEFVDRNNKSVKAGERYRSFLTKGYYIDTIGQRHSIFSYSKRRLGDQYQTKEYKVIKGKIDIDKRYYTYNQPQIEPIWV